MSTKPVLALDIEGVLNRGGMFTPWFDPEDGDALRAMTDVFDLAWASTMSPARAAEALNLPGLPQISHADKEYTKIEPIARIADGRPFVLLDDQVTQFEHQIAARYSQPHLLIEVSPFTGMTPDHLAAARAWALAL